MLSPESLSLLTKPSAGRFAESRPEVGAPAARDEDDLRRAAGELLGYLEAAQIGQHDVEHDQLRLELARERESGGSIGGLAYDLEVLAFEQLARGGTEGRVVVDDQNGGAHVGIVTHWRSLRHRADPEIAPRKDQG